MQKVCSYKCQFCTNVWAFSSHAGLSNSYDGWAKCKEKVPDVSDPNQNVETRFKFTKLEAGEHQKGAEKLVKDESYVCT